MAPLCAGILIGGRSSRMGRDKAALQLDGQSLTRRIASVVTPFVSRVVLIGATDLPDDAREFEHIVEHNPGDGPLAAMFAAHRLAPTRAWLLVACDMPLIHAAALSWLIARRAEQHAAVIPTFGDGDVQPLLAIYEPAAFAGLQSLYEAGGRAPRTFASDPRVSTPLVPIEFRNAWRNVNTPDEWRAL